MSSLPTNVAELQALVVTQERQLADYQNTLHQQQAALVAVTQQRDDYYLEKLRLEVRLAQLLKQTYGPKADRLNDPGQLLLEFARRLEGLPPAPEAEDPPKKTPPAAPPQRGLRTRGRRDLGEMDHLPQIEQVYELPGDLCRCPTCQAERQKIGSEVSYTVEFIPGSFVRIKHVQHKYACRTCEQDGHNPHIQLAAKTKGSPIDKGMPGPSLLAYVATAKFADYLPLNRLENIFKRQGFELDRSTLCQWMSDVALLVRPVYDLMAQRVRLGHVLATDDTVMPLLQPGKTKKARMWIYQGDESQPYNVFVFTVSRTRDGPTLFLIDFKGVLLADAYGGYDGVVLEGEMLRAGCWAHARRKFIDAQAVAPDLVRALVGLIDELFAIERAGHGLSPEKRLDLRQRESAPRIARLHTLLLEHKAQLLPKHPVAQAIGYVLNQWAELTLFLTDGAVPIHNNLAEQQMKRIAILRKNALFVATTNGGATAAILSSLTSTCQRHGIDPQRYFTQLLANLPTTPASQLEEWLPDEWLKRNPPPTLPSAPAPAAPAGE